MKIFFVSIDKNCTILFKMAFIFDLFAEPDIVPALQKIRTRRKKGKLVS